MKTKFIKRLAGLMAFLMLATQITIPAYAASTGACSGHDGVSCSAGADSDGSVICKDEWKDSSVLYADMKDECGNDYVDPAGAAATTTDADDTTTDSNTSADDVSTGGSGGDDSATPTLSEEVDVTNVVDVLSDDVDDENSEDGDDLVDEAVGDLLEDLEGEDEDGAADAIADVEEDIENEINDIEKDIQKNPKMRAKLLKKIMHLKQLRTKLRVKLLKKHIKLAKRIKREVETRKLYEIRWGQLTGKRQRCKGLKLNDLKTALQDREIPEKCQNDVTKVDYSGKISVDKGELKIHKKVLFEKNDSVVTESGSSIAFDSVIAGHWDGLIIEYKPDEGQDEKVNVTVSIGDLEETYVGAEVLGRKKIGNGHMIEIKNLGRVMHGLAKNASNKLILHKVKVQEKMNKLRDKIDRFRLLNKGGEGADDLEEAVDEAGEYNFDDETSDEIQAEIDSLVGELGDGASKEEIKEKAKKLREKLKNFKEKAKKRKFAKKLIPFKDTDDDQWYTNYVSTVKNRGIISGYKDASGNDLGEYRPGNNITVAEIMKIGLETADKGKKKDGKPRLRAALNHWAKEYVAKGEELGLDLVEGDVDLNRPATRGEVVRMMLEALGVDPDNISKTSFSDLKKGHKHAKFIEYAKELGIVSGDAGQTTFRPDAPINRAEAAKIANQIIETLVGGSEE